MSDNELSDGMEELQELIAEYEAKSEKQNKQPTKSTKTKSTKRKRLQQETLDLEVPMDKVIFGDKKGLIKNLEKAVKAKQKRKLKKENVDDDDEDASESEGAVEGGEQCKPAWVDSDDEQIQVDQVIKRTKRTGPLDHLRKDKPYKEYLTTRYTRIMPQPKWATLENARKKRSTSDIDSEDEELLRTVGFVAKGGHSAMLRSTTVHTKRLRDLNNATYGEGHVKSVQFHPTSTAALVAGSSGVATMYAVDGYKNEKLHSIFFEKYPIECARITPCGTKAFFGSIRHFYYTYDLLSAQEMRHTLPQDVPKFNHFELSPCGRYLALAGNFGLLHLFDARAHEMLHSFKQEGTVTGICFTGDSQRLICNSLSSNVTIFSLRKRCLEHSFIDEGCIKGHALDLSPNQRLLATGSKEGVVNVYDFERVQQTSSPLPEKRFLNLTTAISDVRFNHSSELLAFSSGLTPDAIKLAHFPSATVYKNFPGTKPNIGKVDTIAFSPNSAYLALGTYFKQVAFFRNKFFKNY